MRGPYKGSNEARTPSLQNCGTFSVRVQVPNNHILTQNLYNNDCCPTSTWYMDPEGFILLGSAHIIALTFLELHARADGARNIHPLTLTPRAVQDPDLFVNPKFVSVHSDGAAKQRTDCDSTRDDYTKLVALNPQGPYIIAVYYIRAPKVILWELLWELHVQMIYVHGEFSSCVAQSEDTLRDSQGGLPSGGASTRRSPATAAGGPVQEGQGPGFRV